MSGLGAATVDDMSEWSFPPATRRPLGRGTSRDPFAADQRPDQCQNRCRQEDVLMVR